MTPMADGVEKEFRYDISPALRELRRLQTETEQALDRLDGATPTVRPQVDDSGIVQAERRIEGIDAARPTVRVEADGSGLESVERRIDEIDRTPIKPKIDDSEVQGFFGQGGRFDSVVQSAALRAGGLLAGGLGLAFRAGVQREALNTAVVNQLNLTEADAAAVGLAAGQSYSRGFSSSTAQAFGTAGAIAEQLRSFGDINAIELTRATERAELFATTFQVSTEEAVRSAGQLVRNRIVPDMETAFNVMFAGYQEGLNRQGDLIDTLNEYAIEFSELGLTAEDILALLNSGLEAGARNTDIVADTFKEFGIRVRDETPNIAAAFETLGINQGDFVARLEEGGSVARQATLEVLSSIQQIEDPILRNVTAIELFGSQSEELGSAFQALSVEGGEAFDDLATRAEDAMARVEETSDHNLVRMKNSFLAGVGDMGTALNALFDGDFGTFFGGTKDAQFDVVRQAAAQQSAAGIGSSIRNAFPSPRESTSRTREQFESEADAAARLAAAAEEVTNQFLAMNAITWEPTITAEAISEFNQQARDLAPGVIDAFNDEIATIGGQLTLDIDIDEANGINDVQDLISGVEAQIDGFKRRREAADRLDILGLEELAAAVRAGEYDGLIDDILEGEGGTTAKILEQAEAALGEVNELRIAAATEAAERYKEQYAETLINGETDPFAEWFESIEFDQEDLAGIARQVAEGLISGDSLAEARASGAEWAASFLEGANAAGGTDTAVGGSFVSITPFAAGAIVKPRPGGVLGRVAENTFEELLMNAGQPFNRNLDLLSQFDDGRFYDQLRQFLTAESSAGVAVSNVSNVTNQHLTIEAPPTDNPNVWGRQALSTLRRFRP